MTAPVILLEATPKRTSDGAAVTVRLAGGGDQVPYRYGANDWLAGIVQLPTLITSIDFGTDENAGGEFGEGGVPQAISLQWAPSSMSKLADISGRYWFDTAVTVRIGPEDPTLALPAIALSGKALSATISGGVMTIAMSDPAADLKKPLLTARYGGTGDLDGPAEWQGKIKRRVWGRVWNVALEPIDKAYNIYSVADPTKPLQSIDAVRDQGAAAASLTTVAWAGSASATLTALRAAAAPAGGGVVAPSISCVKWWTQPGALHADVKGEIGSGYVETTAAIVERIVQAGANTPFAAGTVAAAVTARPAPVGWMAKDDSTSQASMIQELLGNSSLLWLIDASGKIVLRQWAWGASVVTAQSVDVKRIRTLRPTVSRQLGFRRNESPMARGDIAGIVFSSVGTNQFANSHFRDGLAQWSGWNGNAGNGTLTMSAGKAVMASPAPGSGLTIIASMYPVDGSTIRSGLHLFRVTPGQRLAFRARATGSRSNFRFLPYWRFFTQAAPSGSEMSGSGWADDSGIAGVFPGWSTKIDPTHNEAAGYIDVPAGAYWAYPEFYGLSESDTSALSISIEALQFSYISPDQVAPPEWSEGPTGEYRSTYGADWNSNVANIPYDTIVNNDDSTALGFNGSFEAWSGSLPDGWSNWSGAAPSKETSVVRLGKYSLKTVGAGGDNQGMQRIATWTGSPMPVATFVAGTFDINLGAVTSGLPTIIINLFVDAGLTTARSTILSPPSSATGMWQTVNFVARVNAGERIYGIQIYLLGSWNGGSRPFVGTAYWDRLQFAFFNGSLDNQQVTIQPDGALVGAGGGQVTISGLAPSLDPNADVTSDIVGAAEISVNADYSGTVTDTLPRTEQYALQRLGANVAGSASWSVTVLSGTISATIGASTGLLSLNTSGGVLTTSKLELAAAYGGQTRKYAVKVTRKNAAPPASGSGGATVNDGGFSGSSSSTTFVPIGNELNVACGPGGTATLRASYEFDTAAISGSQGLFMQWGRWNGASYTMLGTQVAHTDAYVPGSGLPGSGSCDYNDSGLGAYAIARYQLFVKNNAGTITRNITGNESVVGG